MAYTLEYGDRFLRKQESAITSDTSDSIAFASIPDNVATRLVAEWTGKQFSDLFSALSVGAKLMFPDDANEIIWQLLKVVHQPIPLDTEDDGGCVNFKPYAPFITYEPSNPFNTPDLIPDGYINQPFHYNSDLAYPELLGYQVTDVIVPIDAIPVFGDWGDLLGLNFPTIKVHVVGQGQIEVDFLAIALGGQCIVKIGSPPNIIDIIDGIIETGVKIIDLGQDLTAIPPESDTVIAEEIDVDAPEGTDVYFVFVPKIDASTEFFGMGGGIRQIGLCGLETDAGAMGIEDIRFVDAGYPNWGMEKRIAGVWSNVENWAEVNAIINDAWSAGNRAQIIAEALRETWGHDDGAEWDSEYLGFEDSALQAYIDAAGEDFDPSALEAAIAAAQSDADAAAAAAAAAQSTANGAVSVNTTQSSNISTLQSQMTTAELDIDIAQADILALATQLDSQQDTINALSFGGVWAWINDFTINDNGYTGTFCSYTSSVGWVATGGGTEAILEYQGEYIKQNQIDTIEVQIAISGGSGHVVELGWLGTYSAAMESVGGGLWRGWLRVPNMQFADYAKFRVRTNSGAITVKYVRYKGTGEVIPFD